MRVHGFSFDRHVVGTILTGLATAGVVALVVGALLAPPAGGQQTVRLVKLAAGAATDCRENGQAYVIRQEVHGDDLASKRLRWGPCLGVVSAECNDLGGRCITTEAERAQAQEWMIYRMVGCSLDPGESVTYTAGGARWVGIGAPEPPGQTERWEEQVEDAGLAGLTQAMRREYTRACATPTPTPSPTPTATPTPTPTVTPTPTPRPTPTPPSCEPIEIPGRFQRTMEFAPTWNTPTQSRFNRLKALAAWVAEHIGDWRQEVSADRGPAPTPVPSPP